MEMEKPVRDIQPQLSLKGIPKSPRLSACCFGTYEDLSMLKGNDISRPGKMKKPAMQLRHAPVRDQDYAQGGQARQAA